MSEPAAADKIVAGSRLLDGIAKWEPGLVGHPLQKDRQHWIASGTDHPVEPSRVRFGIPSVEYVDVKPASYGFYTSTAMSAGYSMWRALIGLDTSGQLYRRPWYTWVMEVDTDDIRVAEIMNASKWVEFVTTYGRVSDGVVYPDWAKVADDFDAVHITLPAVAAAQGFHFRTRRGLIPPAFWDVETTFWVTWRFSSAQLVDTVDGY